MAKLNWVSPSHQPLLRAYSLIPGCSLSILVVMPYWLEMLRYPSREVLNEMTVDTSHVIMTCTRHHLETATLLFYTEGF